MPYSNTDQENGFLKLLNVPLKQFQPLVKQCTEVLLQFHIIQKFMLSKKWPGNYLILEFYFKIYIGICKAFFKKAGGS